MKIKLIFLTFTLLLLGALLAGCTGGSTVASSWPGLSVTEDSVYVAYNSHVYSVQLSNGVERWRYPEKPQGNVTFYADPSVSPDGQVIVGSYNNTLYSLQPQAGDVNWEFKQTGNRFIAGPTTTDQLIYTAGSDKSIYAVDMQGNKVWSFTTEAAIWSKPIFDEACSCVYATSMDHRVYALDAENGALLWKSDDLGGSLVGQPAVSEAGVLFVGTFGSEVIALNSQNGSVLWRTPTEGWVWSGPALAEDRLYVGDLNGFFYALSAERGDVIWQLEPAKLDGPISGTPLVVEDKIFISTESGTVFALSPEGAILWNQKVTGKLYNSPVLAGDLLLVAPVESENLLVAYSQDGAEKWKFTPEK